GPGLAFVVTCPDRHVVPFRRAGRVQEKQYAFPATPVRPGAAGPRFSLRPGITKDTGLTDRLHQFGSVFGHRPGDPTIIADRMSAAGTAEVRTHVHQQRSVTVGQLYHLAFVDFRPDRLAQLPGLTMIVA